MSTAKSRWMYKNKERKLVPKDEIEIHLNQGWQIGWIRLEGDSHYRENPRPLLKWMHQGSINELVKIEDIDDRLNQGWKMGMLLPKENKIVYEAFKQNFK